LGGEILRSLILEILGAVVAGVVLFVLLQLSIWYAVVDGQSMEPTLKDREVLLVSKLHYYFGDPQRGDIIAFPPPHIKNPDSDYIKRIIGLPGETVEIKSGTVYINSSPLNEPYLENPGSTTMAAFTVPDGEYFVLGDNRTNSLDSRGGWTVPLDTIDGRAWFAIWPPGTLGPDPNYDLHLTVLYP
jgi:signal peptidase I